MKAKEITELKIRKALSGTYGQGINPDRIKAMFEALKAIAECEDSHMKLNASDAKGFIQIAKKALQSSLI